MKKIPLAIDETLETLVRLDGDDRLPECDASSAFFFLSVIYCIYDFSAEIIDLINVKLPDAFSMEEIELLQNNNRFNLMRYAMAKIVEFVFDAMVADVYSVYIIYIYFTVGYTILAVIL